MIPTATHEKKALWQRALGVAGVILILLAIQPGANTQFGSLLTKAEQDYVAQNPEQLPFRQEYTLGWRSSPLCVLYRYQSLQANDKKELHLEVSSGYRVAFISWSTATLILGVALLKIVRSKRRA